MKNSPKWKIYERLVACLEVENAGIEVSVSPNARLLGSISGAERQIDVLVDARWESGTKRRIIFDAKRRGRKIHIKDVGEFLGMMADVRAERGVLVCTNGWTNAAKKRADAAIELRLMTEEQTREFDFGAIEPCPLCARRARKSKGVIFLDGQFGFRLNGVAVVFTGKCDECRSFAFWCWECGEKKVVPDKVVHICNCQRKWFVEEREGETVFLVRMKAGEVLLDRRPLA